MVRPVIVPTPAIVIVPVPVPAVVVTAIVPGLLGAWLNVIAIWSSCSMEPAVPPCSLNATVLIGVKSRRGVNATVCDVHTVADVAWIWKHHHWEMSVPVTLTGELAGVEKAP